MFTTRDGIELLLTLTTTGLVGLLALMLRGARRARAAEQHQEKLIKDIIELFTGVPANRLLDRPARPGLVAQIHAMQTQLRQLQADVRRLDGGTT
jgi:hypothetical protein